MSTGTFSVVVLAVCVISAPVVAAIAKPNLRFDKQFRLSWEYPGRVYSWIAMWFVADAAIIFGAGLAWIVYRSQQTRHGLAVGSLPGWFAPAWFAAMSLLTFGFVAFRLLASRDRDPVSLHRKKKCTAH